MDGSTITPRAGAAPAARLLLGLSAAAILAGCGGGGGGAAGQREARPLSVPNRPLWQEPKSGAASSGETGPSRPALVAGDGREALSAYAMDLQSLFDQLKAPPEGQRPGAAALAPQIAAGPSTTSSATMSGAPASATPASAIPDPAGAPAAPPQAHEPPTPVAASEAAEVEPVVLTEEERRAELLSQLTMILGRAGGGGEPLGGSGPLARAVRLAALEAIEPGVARAELDRLEAELLPAEAAVLRPLREMFARLGGSAAGPGDPAAIAELMERYSHRLAEARPLSLPTAVLCERVESFGRYTPLRSTTLAAGREHTAILYVEVENFAQRTAPGGAAAGVASERWITELAQSLDLHHDGDGSLQWRQSEQVVRDDSRRRRSDYYLVQRVTLPRTLSVGRYNLKVTVTDKVSGQTAQARIPIQIVADPALASPR